LPAVAALVGDLQILLQVAVEQVLAGIFHPSLENHLAAELVPFPD
jgi:hypothetical protein